jgi:transitional endoplasmic reticulum ATPase
MARRFTTAGCVSTELDAIVQLWLLRILVPMGRHREFVQAHSFNSDTLAEALGLGHWVDPVQEKFIPRTIRSELRALHLQAEQKWASEKAPVILRMNAESLAGLVGLSHTDCRILEFAVLIQSEQLLDDTADWLGLMSSVKVFHALSVILALPENDIRSALSPQSILSRSGLVSVDRSSHSTLRNKLNLLSDEFADLLMSPDTNLLKLLRGTVNPVAPSELGLDDYGHIGDSLQIALPYLRQVLEMQRKGVNIYMHGAPGTGKSQLARVLAAELGCELFEVASEDNDGDPISGDRRLRAFRAAQSFFAQRRALIVFDEVEDVFNDGDHIYGRKSTAQTRKAWINRMLEENPVPTLWLSNSGHGLDPAFIRRFDMVFELPVPPKAQRQRIASKVCLGLVGEASVARLSEVEDLAPAVMAKAAGVVRVLGPGLDAAMRAKALEQLVGNTLAAQGHAGLRSLAAGELPDLYDPAFTFADANLAQLADGLKHSGAGRLCLYGPPGTGKTAYGRWLAEQLGAPLLVKRASDLMSAYVGESERNIARAFREADRDGAVLLIDEVDSFLQDRRGASRSWEVSMVNEMLTQMESFPGLFIASTNLMDSLDPAVLRRFDLKVKFGYLGADQAGSLLARYCQALGLPAPDDSSKLAVRRLHHLTPGDYAAILRRHRFQPVATVAQLVEILQGECALKGETRHPVGFVH